MSFARTKIQPPRLRPGLLVERPRLADALGRALLQQRLVLLNAPAGYGKTLALASLLLQRGPRLPADVALAWISLDEGDDLARVLECLIAALEPYDPPWRLSPEALVVMAGQPGKTATVAAELINTLDACEAPHGVIVLDDLHRSEDPALFACLDRLLERLGSRWTLAITSRLQPPLAALSRLRAQGEVLELGEAQLRFLPEEAQRLGEAQGSDPARLQDLMERTQGWPAGLRLALNTLQSAGPAMRLDHGLFDYLAAEVLDQLTPELRDFLLATAVLPEITATRGAALSGNPAALRLMDEIERRGLFVTSLADHDRTLRLHDLFRDALEHRLQREQPERLPELLRRAALSEPDLVRRLGYWLRARDWDAAERELDEAAADLLTAGAVAAVQRILARFPAERRESSPLLARVAGLLAWAQWDWLGMPEAMARCAAAFQRLGDEAAMQEAQVYLAIGLSGAGQNERAAALIERLREAPLAPPSRCRWLVAAGWMALHEGRLDEIAPLLARQVELLEGLPRLQYWYEALPLPAYAGLPGARAPLLRYVTGVLQRVPGEPTAVRCVAWVLQAWLLLWSGEPAAAANALENADADSRWLGRPANLEFQLCMARLAWQALSGDSAGFAAQARQLIDATSTTEMRQRMQPALTLVAYHVGRLSGLAGVPALLDEALALLQDPGHMLGPWLAPEQLGALQAQRELAAGRLDTALAGWQGLAAARGQLGLFGQETESALRTAELLLRLRRLDEAAALLGPALARVDADREGGKLALAGPAVLAALAQAPWAGRLAPAALQLLQQEARRAVAARQPPPAASARPAATAAGGPRETPLSERERAVLARIAAGDSNKLIARAFELSPHTVKRHVANILDKLALASRGQAAAWWREQQGAR